eukprot:TRINITY_DN3094_c0_g1_i9.p2 TRINITY_DN3094_c0_g1~~TRINITY_DN3094_c0_g1_i9.p2  ORF type:complete len:134 (-),score=7.78 TRINITY_DN3094_c0_g1_i9:163-564(-)
MIKNGISLVGRDFEIALVICNNFCQFSFQGCSAFCCYFVGHVKRLLIDRDVGVLLRGEIGYYFPGGCLGRRVGYHWFSQNMQNIYILGLQIVLFRLSRFFFEVGQLFGTILKMFVCKEDQLKEFFECCGDKAF